MPEAVPRRCQGDVKAVPKAVPEAVPRRCQRWCQGGAKAVPEAVPSWCQRRCPGGAKAVPRYPFVTLPTRGVLVERVQLRLGSEAPLDDSKTAEEVDLFRRASEVVVEVLER